MSWFINGSTSYPGFAEIQKKKQVIPVKQEMEKNKDGEELDIHASQGAATTPITLLVIGE